MPQSSDASPLYRHTQFGTLVVSALAAGLVLCLAMGFISSWHPALLAPAAILVVILGLFNSLTTVVTRSHVAISFGPGLISKAIPLADIEAATPDRIGLLWGWGIRYWPGRGWMWNVSGFDVVLLELAGGRQFRVGTDDPEGLADKIREANGALA